MHFAKLKFHRRILTYFYVSMLIMRRYMFLVGFLLSVALLATAYYFEYGLKIKPCPLCIMQRLCYYLIAIISLVAFWHNPKIIARRIYLGFIALFALCGAGFAIRQIYLQHLPAGQAPPCAPGLNFMLQNFPLHQTLDVLFNGSGDCAKVHWTFLGLAMSEWSLLFLLSFVIAAVFFYCKN